MKPTSLGIHAPYTWDEPTYLATSLADFAVRLGVPVSLLSNQAHDEGVHYRWDNTVLSGKRNAFGPWSQDRTHLVWFDIQKKKLLEAKKDGKHNTLVVLWHRLKKEDLDALPLYDAVVCPHRAVFDRLGKFPGNLYYIPWDCGMPITDSPMPGTGHSVYCPIDAYTAKKLGPLLMNTFRTLLDFDENVHFTIAYTRKWPTAAVQCLGDLIRHRPDRIRLLKRPTHVQRMEAYTTHDWVFVPSLKENCGLFAREALCCGKPVIAFDTVPHSELIQDGHNGSLVPCEVTYDWLKAPEAVVNSFDLGEQLRLVCAEQPNFYAELLAKPWPEVKVWREAFEAGWRNMWGFD